MTALRMKNITQVQSNGNFIMNDRKGLNEFIFNACLKKNIINI